MFLRAVHAEHELRVLQQLILENPLGILTTAIKSPNHPLIQSSHIPFALDIADKEEDDAPGILRGHIAKQNPQAKVLMEAAQGNQELSDEVLVLFHGPHHHYITPKFYTETKPQTGKVVPTWNYAAAQAYGKIKVYSDSKSEETNAFLDRQLDDLTRHSELSLMGYAADKAWNVSDAPESYVGLLKKNIIGVEIRIERLQGKFKMSQELADGDREGVVRGFEAMNTEGGKGMAETVKERAELKKKAGQ